MGGGRRTSQPLSDAQGCWEHGHDSIIQDPLPTKCLKILEGSVSGLDLEETRRGNTFCRSPRKRKRNSQGTCLRCGKSHNMAIPLEPGSTPNSSQLMACGLAQRTHPGRHLWCNGETPALGQRTCYHVSLWLCPGRVTLYKTLEHSESHILIYLLLTVPWLLWN